jgi:hypothetical protein
MNMVDFSRYNDPLEFQKFFWPQVYFYAKQQEIIYSVRDNAETYVVAGNKLGKDFVAAFIALSFFLAPTLYFPVEYVRQVERLGHGADWTVTHKRRIITTSVAEKHLNVLWSEISQFVASCRIPLVDTEGGDIVVNKQTIRWAVEGGKEVKNANSYLIGQVSEKGEKMAGHHAPYTLLIVDEASGSDDEVHKQGQGWAKRMLIFGNPNPCGNYFFRNVQAGDLAG